MTRSKLDLAKTLLKLKGDETTDPASIVKDMSLRRLCHEIQKLEDEQEQTPPPPPAPPKKKRNILSWILDSSDDEA